jgi:hypothetical protein
MIMTDLISIYCFSIGSSIQIIKEWSFLRTYLQHVVIVKKKMSTKLG